MNQNETKDEQVINDEERVNGADQEQVEDAPRDEHAEIIKNLEEKLDEANNRFLRSQADLDNFRRRSRMEKEAAETYRAQSLIEDILPVLDNFERALSVETDGDSSNSIVKGLEMVYRQLLEAIKKEGLLEIEAEGQPFDPHVHQAVMQVEDENYESNVVIEVLQKGYKLKDRVIRPAMVKVNQ